MNDCRITLSQDVIDALRYGLEHKISKDKLLVIELDNESSVPKVFYKGEEINEKMHISFEWDTDTEYYGGLSYTIEHYEKGSYPVINRIERRVKGHCID